MKTDPAAISSQVPDRRAFTRADGRVDFRACLDVAREFRRYAKRTVRYLFQQTDRLTAKQIARNFDQVRDLVAHENERWDALTPSLRAAATLFDSRFPDVTSTDRCCAILALAEGRPAFWHAHQRAASPFADMLNGDPAGPAFIDTTTTVFEALIAREIRMGDTLRTLIPLNAAAERLLRSVRAAIALRSASRAA